jgi:hypothetical protein
MGRRRLRHAHSEAIGVAVARVAKIAGIIDTVESGVASEPREATAARCRPTGIDGDHALARIATRDRTTDLTVGTVGAEGVQLRTLHIVRALVARLFRPADTGTIGGRPRIAVIVRIVDAGVPFGATSTGEAAALG